MKKILVIDDEENIITIIKRYFEDNGYTVLTAINTNIAQELLSHSPDLVLLDIMMPGIDGISFCQEIRDRVSCPIIFLSAKTEENSKLLGLASGGDDYITKPFSVRELFARVEAHIRREGRPREYQSRIFFEDIWIDYSARQCGINESIIALTKKEFSIIELLSLHSGQVFSQERIYEIVWGYDAEGDANVAVTEHIKRIRQKLSNHIENEKIETVWGIGYKWKK